MRSVSSKLTLTELYTSLYHLGDLDRKHLRMILVASIEKCPDMRLRPRISVCQSLCWRHNGTNAYKSKWPMSSFFARPIDGSTTNYLGSQREMNRTMSWTCVRDWASQIGWTTLVRRGAPGVHVIVERISAVT